MKRLLVFGFLFSLVAGVLLSCQKELSQEVDHNTATGSIHDDSTGECFPITVNGTYYNGVSANRDTNFVLLIVNVKSTGNYTIASSLSNGFSFSDSGFFSKIGLDTIMLHAQGAPILQQATDFTVAFDTTVCGFTVDVKDSTGTGLGGVTDTTIIIDSSGSYSASYVDPDPAGDGIWHFTDSTNNVTYSGSIQAGGVFRDNGDGTSNFQCQGFVTTNSNLSLTISLIFPTTSIETGSYQLDGMTTRLFLLNISAFANDYDANAATSNEDADPSYINITSYDAATKRIKGSFRCWAEDANGNPALIKGSFNTVIL